MRTSKRLCGGRVHECHFLSVCTSGKSSAEEGREIDIREREAVQVSSTHSSASHWLAEKCPSPHLPLNIMAPSGALLAAIGSGGGVGVQTFTPSARCRVPRSFWSSSYGSHCRLFFRVAFPSLHYPPIIDHCAIEHSDEHQTGYIKGKSKCFFLIKLQTFILLSSKTGQIHFFVWVIYSTECWKVSIRQWNARATTFEFDLPLLWQNVDTVAQKKERWKLLKQADTGFYLYRKFVNLYKSNLVCKVFLTFKNF